MASTTHLLLPLAKKIKKNNNKIKINYIPDVTTQPRARALGHGQNSHFYSGH